MPIVFLIFAFTLAFTSVFYFNANASPTDGKQTISQCQQQLITSDKRLHQLDACQTLIKSEGIDKADNLFIVGHLLVNTKHKHNSKSRQKRGLFYWVLSADLHNPSAIKALSAFVKTKMVDGKVPIKYGHYLSYLEADWNLNQQDPKHHYAIYQQWLNTVEQSQQDPQAQTTKTLLDVATAFENGYFLGSNLKAALKLYQVTADRNDKKGLYKTAELMLEDNQRDALIYLFKAAELRSGDAMLKLGDFFGCNGNKQQAEKWYRQAIQVGNEYAEEELESLLNDG